MEMRAELLKSIWHAFTALDLEKSGKVSKSQLKVLSHNLCTVLNVPQDPVALEEHFKDDDTGPVSSHGYMPYLNQYILDKVQENCFDKCQFDEVCWMLAAKKNLRREGRNGNLLSNDDAFKVWRIFNFLSEAKYPLIMLPGEVEFLLRKLTTTMGAQWQEDSAELGPLASIIGQNGQELSVWELIALIDSRPLAPGADRLALTLAIDEVYQELLMDIIKKGYLWKKGHKRKNWMERYFLLKSNIISYFVHEDLKEKKGEIVLDKVCNVMPIPDKDGRRFLFLISSFGKSFEISAPDPRQRQAWISSIQSVIRVLEIGNVSVARDMQRRRREQRERRVEERDQLAQRMTDLKEEQERSRQQLENLQQSQHEAEMRALVEEQRRALAQAELQEKYELELLHDKKVIAEMEVEIKAKEVETKAHQERIHELEEMYQQLSAALEMERQAKHEEEAVRELQARLLHDEACKREELERLQEEQEQELSVTRREKAELERESITRQQALENANQQLQNLEAEREEAQRKHQEVSEKLASASTCTQSWRDRVKRCEMLLRPICPGDRPARIVTHRGLGAFTQEQFEIERRMRDMSMGGGKQVSPSQSQQTSQPSPNLTLGSE